MISSGQMLPRFANADRIDERSRKAEPERNIGRGFPGGEERPNDGHIGRRGFRGMHLFAAHDIGAALLIAITAVVHLRAAEQMLRIAARRVVAGMKDFHSIWNRAVGERPRDAMRQVMAMVVKNDAIWKSVESLASGPRPTCVRSSALVDARPEFLFECRQVVSTETLPSPNVHWAKPMRIDNRRAIRRATDRSVATHDRRGYRAFSHDDVPHRCGQKRRKPSHGRRRFVFVPSRGSVAQVAARV